MAREAAELAKVLIKIYTSRKKRFILTKDEFKEISGTERLDGRFLEYVDELLREDGYVLIDLLEERDVIGILRISTIASWERPDIDGYRYEDELFEEDE